MYPHVDQSVDVAAKFGFIDAALGIKRNHVRREDAVDRSWCIHIHFFKRGADAAAVTTEFWGNLSSTPHTTAEVWQQSLAAWSLGLWFRPDLLLD